MNIFQDVNLKWWHVSLLKFSVLFFGIFVGANWPTVFEPYMYQMLGVAAILGVYLGYVWHKQLK